MGGYLPKRDAKAVQPSNIPAKPKLTGSYTGGGSVKAKGNMAMAGKGTKADGEGFKSDNFAPASDAGYNRMFGPTKANDDINAFNKGTGGSNIVLSDQAPGLSADVRADNHVRNPLSNEWIRKERKPRDYNHSN